MYKEEKNRRGGRKNSNKRGTDELSRPEKRSIGNRPPLPRPVDVIAEDDEEPTTTTALISPTSGRIPPANLLPKRADTSQLDVGGRIRAISTSQIQTGATNLLGRKTSSLSAKASIPISQKRSVPGPNPLELSDKPNRTRRMRRDASDTDPDDTMNGSDDEGLESRPPSSFKTPRPPRISKSARDLIDFLDQGPPVNFGPSLPLQLPAVPSPKSTGRFQRMISKLTGSSSNEKLREDAAKLRKNLVTNTTFNATNVPTNPPQTPVKRAPTVVVATPPPRLQSMSQQVTPPNSPPTLDQDSSRPVQRRTSVRKKVPPLEPDLETSRLGPQSPVPRTAPNELLRSPALTNGNGQPNGVNEAHKPASPSPPSPEPEPRTSPNAETVANNDRIKFRRPAPTPPTKITVEVVAPAPLPVTNQPPSPSQGIELSLNAAHAQSLRQLMSMATTADECRVLVDMFLARVGFPINRSTDVDPYPSPISSTDPSDIDLESSVIETLLGGDSSSGPSTVIHSTQPSEAGQADESEMGTSDAETFGETTDSPVQRSTSRITRDTRVNPLPPSATRLLSVA